MLKPKIFYIIHCPFLCYSHLTQKKYTIKNSLTETVFSFASSVDALQNTCVLSKQKVSNEYDRKPDSAPFRDPVVFLQFIKCYGFDINAWDRGILAKKCKKSNEKSHTETSYIYFDNAFINTAS